MHLRRIALGGLVVLASLASTACGASTTSAVDGSRDSSKSDTQTSADLESVLDGLASLSSTRGRLVGECMAAKGFPQPLERLEQSDVDVDPGYDQGPLTIAPIDMGPTTKEEARQYGLVGSFLPLLGHGPAEIVSRNKAFDSAAEECDSAVDRAVPVLRSLQGDGAAFSDEIRRQLIKRSERQLVSLLIDRYACVRDNGYPQLKPEDAVQSDDWEGVLSRVGIRGGKFRVPKSEQPHVAEGEVAVIPPASPRQYVPSAHEVEFGLALVECGASVRFLDRFYVIVDRSRADVSNDYAREAEEFHTRLEEAMDQIDELEF